MMYYAAININNYSNIIKYFYNILLENLARTVLVTVRQITDFPTLHKCSELVHEMRAAPAAGLRPAYSAISSLVIE